jgi:hypothetical protein
MIFSLPTARRIFSTGDSDGFSRFTPHGGSPAITTADFPEFTPEASLQAIFRGL